MKAKWLAFINEYFKDWNGSAAARRAGYKGRSDVIAARLLGNVSIKAEIDRRIAEQAMSADEVLNRLGQMARVDLADFTDERTGEVDLTKAKGKTHLIKKLRKVHGKESDTTEIELYDAQTALQLLGKHHKLFTEKVEHTGKDGEAIIFEVRGIDLQEDV